MCTDHGTYEYTIIKVYTLDTEPHESILFCLEDDFEAPAGHIQPKPEEIAEQILANGFVSTELQSAVPAYRIRKIEWETLEAQFDPDNCAKYLPS